MKNVKAIAAAALVIGAAGCSGDTSTSAQLTASGTPVMPGLVKLVQKSHSGSRVVVDAVLYGPEPNLDLFAYNFAIHIGDTRLVRLVPQMTYTQHALVAGMGQSIAIQVDEVSDPSLVQVSVIKLGGGAGNGFTTSTAVLIELTFDVSGSGQTSLTLTGRGGQPPKALDHALAPIAGVTFDTASAGIRGVSTGGRY